MDYPAEVKETIKALEVTRQRYQLAIQKDHPGDEIEDIKNEIVAHRSFLVKWINAFDKQYATSLADTEKRKSKLYKELVNNPEVTKSGRIDHVRYTFKKEDGELDQLKILTNNMKRWDRYYQDLVINIQSSLSSIRTEKRVEGL